MPRSRSGGSPRLRASQALPLAILILVAVLFGTPSRHDRQEAMAQSPPLIPPRPVRASRRARTVIRAVSDPGRARKSRSFPADRR